jgi:multidrug transporter EmrE-like cation transporter
MIFLKLVAIIIVRTCGDICFKAAVNRLNFTSVSSVLPNIFKLVRNPFFILGLFFGVSNLFIWWFSLKDFDLSYAYPFLSISYITIIIAGKVVFKEHLDKKKIIGICFITLGALVLFLG